ncbi:acyltransferase [Luteolibacter pohnpeiensis]|uniref:Acyltransferase n=1 Tax=Luteolibacter pohnpeiensis TaxID=454153 RepID=A0A934VVX5_9BACT|nr:acyltransferase [Luteolibacter pohnpeiensis]MBK1882680.1 acyltransferase [Luteolibacter pohnpeiensis]
MQKSQEIQDGERRRLINAVLGEMHHDAEQRLAGEACLELVLSQDPRSDYSSPEKWLRMVDQKRANPSWMWIGWALVLLLSLASGFLVYGKRYQILDPFWIYSYSDSSSFSKIEDSELSVKEKLILNGFSVSGAKKLWDLEPENAAYFANYSLRLFKETGELPPDFLNTGRKIDPGNAWYNLVEAAYLSKDAVSQEPAGCVANVYKPYLGYLPSYKSSYFSYDIGPWGIDDLLSYKNGLSLLDEIEKLPRIENYQNQYAAELNHVYRSEKGMPKEVLGYMIRVNDQDHARMLEGGIDLLRAKVWDIGKSGNPLEFAKFCNQDLLLLRRMVECSDSGLIGQMVERRWIEMLVSETEMVAEKLELVDAYPWLSVMQMRLKEDHNVIADCLPVSHDSTGTAAAEYASRKVASNVFTFSMCVPRLAPVDISELKIARLSEIASFVVMCVICSWVIFVVSIGVISIYRFSVTWSTHRLGARVVKLLTMGDWLWIFGVGVLAPVSALSLMLFLCSEFLHQHLFVSAYIDVLGINFSMYLVDFIVFVLLALFLPVQISIWRLSRRVKVFGFKTAMPLGWASMIAAFSALIALVSQAPNWLFVSLALIAFCLLILGLIRPLLGSKADTFRCQVLARVTLTSYGFMLFNLAIFAMVACLLQQYWFEKDIFSQISSEEPAMSRYEFRVAEQLKRDNLNVLDLRNSQ